MSERLVQLQSAKMRRVALVQEPNLRLLAPKVSSIYALVGAAMAEDISLSKAASRNATDEHLGYDAIYAGASDWKILPAIDHPEPARCLVSGTGLTHLGSARDRQAMHAPSAEKIESLTDSMKMFRWGLAGGRPQPHAIGTPPEWFYKGTGSSLRAHGELLTVPSYADDGGEEAEIAGIYVIDPQGQPCRIGMAIGNEFSDHCFEKQNYLYLASSKLRNCSIGPELVIDPEFESVAGEVIIERAGRAFWRKQIRTGQAEMCHSLQNIEHHHFKYESHRQPGDVHVHFLGADCLSFGEGIRLAEGDVMQIAFDGFGRPLRNAVRINDEDPKLISVVAMK